MVVILQLLLFDGRPYLILCDFEFGGHCLNLSSSDSVKYNNRTRRGQAEIREYDFETWVCKYDTILAIITGEMEQTAVVGVDMSRGWMFSV